MVIQIVKQLRPHVLLVLPPYDHLNLETCKTIRSLGTRIIGLSIDDPKFENLWDETAWTDLRGRFDLWATTAVDGPTIRAGAKPVLWVMAAESVKIIDPTAPGYDAVLLGAYSLEREATAHAVASTGINIACFGRGWAAGTVTRPSMLGLMSKAKVVITPSDGVNATKIPMIEAALLGARQIIEYSDGLERYFSGNNPPATYGTPQECAERLSSGAPLPEWTDIPGWNTEWPKLLADIPLSEQPERASSPALEQLYASLAHMYEQRGHLLAAIAYLDAWKRIARDGWGATFALARCGYRMGSWAKAAKLAKETEDCLHEKIPAAASNIRFFAPQNYQGKGLGYSGAFDFTLEMTAIRLYSLLMDNKLEEALEEVHGMSSVRRSAVRAAMLLDWNDADSAELSKALDQP